jgi:hypothetical protein
MDYSENEHSGKAGLLRAPVEIPKNVPESQALKMLLDPEGSITNFHLAPNGEKDNWGETRGRFVGSIKGSHITMGEIRKVDILVLGPNFLGRAAAKARRREPRAAIHITSR